MNAITIKAYTESKSQIDAIKAFMKALKIKFEMKKESPYNSDFVNMINDAEDDISKGKGIRVSSDKLDELWK